MPKLKGWLSYLPLLLCFFSEGVFADEQVRVKLTSWDVSKPIFGDNIAIRTKDKGWEEVPSGSYIHFVSLGLRTGWSLREKKHQTKKQFYGSRLRFRGKNFRYKKRALSDNFFLTREGDQVLAIASISFEKYILGVLLSELPFSWPLEALKAQAVAIRSYTRSVIGERELNIYQLDSSVLDQVYDLKFQKKISRKVLNKFQRAVRETKGWLLQNKRGEVLRAFYHSDCGGRTTSAFNVWGGGVRTEGVKDPSCPISPGGHWKFTIGEKALQNILQEYFALGSFVSLVNIKKFSYDVSGRVEKLALQFEFGIKRYLSSQRLRELIGFKKIRSTFLKLTKSDGVYYFRGRGFGHGVGLCQWGSRYLAQEGWDFVRILRHYYKGNYLINRENKLIALKVPEKIKSSVLKEKHAQKQLK